MNALKTLFCALALTAALCAQAETPINERRPVNADVQLRIENIGGTVKVRSGGSDVVVVGGSLGEGSRPLQIDGDGRRLTIRVEPEEGRGTRRMAGSALDITMPAGGRLEVLTVSADIDVGGIHGSGVELESVSGDIVYVGDATAVHLKSVSGNVRGEGGSRDWTLGTVSGDIDLPHATGSVRAETVSGRIGVQMEGVDRVRVESVSGALSAAGVLAPSASLAIQSVSGEITLELAGQVDARIRANTFSGRVESSIGTPERSGIGGGYRLEGVAGSGSADVRLESFSGRIRVGGAAAR